MKGVQGIVLHTERLTVRTPKRGDGSEYARYYAENREFLQPFSPTFNPEIFSARGWESSISLIDRQLLQGLAVRFAIFSGERLIGVANYTDVKGSPLHAALLGYTLSESEQGKGLMFEALRATNEYMFSALELNRVSANYMPRNERSGRLLRKLGFNVEGYARDYLLIDGKWEDHVLTSLLRSRTSVSA
jgi:ribosomal-protein-alanine N-acetyltransferase